MLRRLTLTRTTPTLTKILRPHPTKLQTASELKAIEGEEKRHTAIAESGESYICTPSEAEPVLHPSDLTETNSIALAKSIKAEADHNIANLSKMWEGNRSSVQASRIWACRRFSRRTSRLQSERQGWRSWRGCFCRHDGAEIVGMGRCMSHLRAEGMAGQLANA
jgi:hypothetical protein